MLILAQRSCTRIEILSRSKRYSERYHLRLIRKLMKKSNRPDRDISNYHEILPKEERPEQGKRYILNMNDEPTCVADVTEFDGGCWAKVKVVGPASEKYQAVYHENMEFEIKVAYYRFQELAD